MTKWLFIIGLCISHVFKAIDIGSDSVVNRFNTQQVLSTGDRIAGFAALVGGFRLDGGLTTATFDSFMPVSGDIEQDGGTLILNHDLIFQVPARWLTIGSIVGNQHVIELARTMTTIASSSYAGPSGGNTQYDCEITFTLNTNLTQSINSVSWSYDDRFIAVGCNSSASQEVRVYAFDSNAIALTFQAGSELGANVESVSWHPSKHVLAVGRVSGTSEELYTFTYNQASPALTELSAIDFGGAGNSVNRVAWHPTGDYLAVAGATNTAEIRVYPVNSDGSLNVAGLLAIDISGANDANVVAWDASGNYLSVGLAGGTELQVYSFATSPSLSLTLNASVAIGSAINDIHWNPIQQNIIAVGLAAGTLRVRLYTHNSGAGTLTEILTGLSLAVQTMSVHWKDEHCISIGKVSNATGELSTLLFSNNALNVQEDIEVGSNVNTVQWSHSGNFLATGKSNGDLTIYLLDSAFIGPRLYFSDLGFFLNSDLTLKNCNICFSGNSFIEGRNHILSFEPTCTVSIANNSTLQCSNLTIKGLAHTSLQGLSESSKLILDNTLLVLDDDYTFAQGTIDVMSRVVVRGDAHFIYQSAHPLLVREKSSLQLDEGITLSCDSQSASCLQFVDHSSRLLLNGAALHATIPGLQLTKGTLYVNDTSNIESEVDIMENEAGAVTIIDNGITLGNNVSSDDMKIVMAFNAVLQCMSGSINYKNVNNSSFKFIASQPVLHMFPYTQLRIYQSLLLGFGVLIFDENTTLAILNGKTLTGSIASRANSLRRIAIPEVLT